MKMNIVASVLAIFTLPFGLTATNNILEDYKSFGIIPEVLDKAPDTLLKIYYNDNELQFGKEYTPTQIKDAPVLEWNFDSSSFYTLVLNDPDAPSRQDPIYREFLHWIVVNIPGDKFSSGEHLVEYIGSGAPKDSGLHRYVFSVFKQPDKINFSEKPINSVTLEGRLGFSLKNFANKYNFDGPIAGIMFQAQYDDSVIEFYKKLGVDM